MLKHHMTRRAAQVIVGQNSARCHKSQFFMQTEPAEKIKPAAHGVVCREFAKDFKNVYAEPAGLQAGGLPARLEQFFRKWTVKCAYLHGCFVQYTTCIDEMRL